MAYPSDNAAVIAHGMGALRWNRGCHCQHTQPSTSLTQEIKPTYSSTGRRCSGGVQRGGRGCQILAPAAPVDVTPTFTPCNAPAADSFIHEKGRKHEWGQREIEGVWRQTRKAGTTSSFSSCCSSRRASLNLNRPSHQHPRDPPGEAPLSLGSAVKAVAEPGICSWVFL